MKKLLIFILCLGLFFGVTMPASAVIRESKIPPNTILYKSTQTWRDTSNNPWQVVFFKQVDNQKNPQINLRLVGFPDLFEFSHPQPLTIKIREDLRVKAPDIFASDEDALTTNMGQYDFSPIIEQLESNNFWLLELPLKDGKVSTIKNSYFILEEWKNIITKSKTDNQM